MTDSGAVEAASRPRREVDEERWAGLMVRAQGGDSSAYRDLLAELGGAAAAYLRRHFGDLQLTEDCVQESLLSLHRARHSYDSRRPFRPWFFTIVKHKTLDILRRHATRARYEVSHAESETHATSSIAAKGEAVVEATRFLAGLSPPHREALILTKLEGHSIPEAARVAGISSMAMKSRVHRAIRLTQKRLEAEAP